MYARNNKFGIEIVIDPTVFADGVEFIEIPLHLSDWVNEYWRIDEGGNFKPPSEQYWVEQIKNKRLSSANNDLELQLAELVAGYSEGEIKSWPQQIKEAEALSLNENAETPFLSVLANTRQIDLHELAGRVMQKSMLYSTVSAKRIGARQRIEDLLTASNTAEEALAVPTLEELLRTA